MLPAACGHFLSFGLLLLWGTDSSDIQFFLSAYLLRFFCLGFVWFLGGKKLRKRNEMFGVTKTIPKSLEFTAKNCASGQFWFL